MFLKDWISQVGDAKASEIMGKPVRTVASYRRGEAHPTAKVLRQLPVMTGHLVTTLADVFGDPS